MTEGAVKPGVSGAPSDDRQPPDISVIVPHYEDLSRLDLCLAALAGQEGGLDFEIVVADNMSPSGEAAVRRTIGGRARLITATQKGAGPARNAGVAAARGRILAFTDCDCIPEPAWLKAGVAALDAHDFAGGRMTVLVSDPARMSGAEGFERVFAFDNQTYVEQKGFTVTANLFCPRALFDAVGNFRDGVSEDLEWCHRARDAGFRIGYAANAVAGHPARADWEQLRHKWRRLNAETFALYADKPQGRLKWLLRSLALPVSILAHAPAIVSSAAVPGVKNKVRALGALVQIRLWRFGDSLGLVFRRNS